MKNQHNSNLIQSGQAILVIALVMVGLIGALGLAVDGGGLALLHRDAQNAADAAALAAAYARCTGGDISNAATTAAAENGFVTSAVTVQSPVAVVPAGSGVDQDRNNYVSVSVSASKQAYFIQILYPAGLQTTATATAHCTPGVTGSGSGGLGYAMFGLGPVGGTGTACHSGCDAIEANNLNIEGAVHSNDPRLNWSANVSVSGTGSWNTFRSDPLSHLNISQFAPGGAVWNRVPSNLRFSVTAAQFNALSAGSIHGLYYITSGYVNRSLSNANLQPFTIVSADRIRLTTFNKGLTAFVDDVLAFSNYQFGNANACDTNTAIYINGSGNSRGIVYSPHGQQEVLYSGGTWVGSLVGRYVDWWGSGSAISTLRALPAATAPQVSITS